MNRIPEMGKKIRMTLEEEFKSMEKAMEEFSKFKSGFLNLLEEHNPAGEACSRPVVYKVGTLFLQECFSYLMESEDEVMHLVSGIRLSKRCYTLDRIEKVQFAASAVSAKADTRGLFVKLNEIDEKFGHTLLAVFHSHISKEASGTTPSGIDRKLQTVLEKSGYKAIQAVFSRDGFVRFFSNSLPFEIELFGKGMQKLEEKENERIFKFDEGRVQDVYNRADKGGCVSKAVQDSGVQPKNLDFSGSNDGRSRRPWRRIR